MARATGARTVFLRKLEIHELVCVAVKGSKRLKRIVCALQSEMYIPRQQDMHLGTKLNLVRRTGESQDAVVSCLVNCFDESLIFLASYTVSVVVLSFHVS